MDPDDIQNALKAGASIEEIFEVLKICVAQGVQACNLGVPILGEELKARQAVRTRSSSACRRASSRPASSVSGTSGSRQRSRWDSMARAASRQAWRATASSSGTGPRAAAAKGCK